jgi:hypothetical protein
MTLLPQIMQISSYCAKGVRVHVPRGVWRAPTRARIPVPIAEGSR